MLLHVLVWSATAGYRCHHNIEQNYCRKCPPGTEPPGGGPGFLSRDGVTCKPYNNPGTNCTDPMSVDKVFDARVTQDVVTMYEGNLGLVPDPLACGR